MKRNLFKLAGVAAAVLMALMVLAGCDQGCTYGDCYTKADGETHSCASSDCAAFKANNRNKAGQPSSAACDCR
jgi:hypothetical protein